MKTIKINRNPTLNFRTGEVKIFAGQKEIGVLNDYETSIDVSVEENEKIWAKLQFCSSNRLQIDKDIKEVYLTSFLSNSLFVIILGSVLIFTLLAIFTKFTFFGFFPIIVVLYPLYYITLGRSKYLKISTKDK